MKPLLGLLLVMGMVGCGGDDAATPQPDADATPLPDAATVKQTLTPAQLAVGDPIENSIGMVLVPIPAGEFLMGSPETEPGRLSNEVQHQVTLTKPFLLGVHEVTQGQWQAVMGTTPWKGKQYVKEGDDYPATHVNSHDAVEFCRQLSEKRAWNIVCRQSPNGSTRAVPERRRLIALVMMLRRWVSTRGTGRMPWL